MIPVSLNPGESQAFIESVAWGIRTATRKMLDPLGHFRERLERLVAEDLVVAIDICDDLGEDRHPRELLDRLIEKAGLEDISPQVGERFDARHQVPVGFREGDAPDQILRVMRRGLRYKGRQLRPAHVVLGR